MSQLDQRPSLPERIASGELRFLRNIDQSPWTQFDDEQYMVNLISFAGRECLVLDQSMAPDGTFGTVPGTGVYMLIADEQQNCAE